ncbi:MAG: hypothetical protein WCS51_03585 [Bacilli bacterium]
MLLSYEYVKNKFDFDDDEESFITDLISLSIAKVESVLDRELELKERSELANGGSKFIFLSTAPILDANMYLDETRAFNESTLIDPLKYNLNLENGVVKFYEKIPKGEDNIKIIYTAGYTEETLPTIIKQALLEVISSNFNKMRDRAFGIKNRTSPEGTNIQYDFEMSLETKQSLDKLRFERV